MFWITQNDKTLVLCFVANKAKTTRKTLMNNVHLILLPNRGPTG